tara:strand:- start:95 stop:205 length:111 start_codon:yes stop_codon:yes gene_type:complete
VKNIPTRGIDLSRVVYVAIMLIVLALTLIAKVKEIP